jgi:hypothetical protein
VTWHGHLSTVTWCLRASGIGEVCLGVVSDGDVACAVVSSSDVAYAVGGGGDVVVGVNENALAWPIWALTRGTAGTAMTAGLWDGGGRWNRCDGPIFGNGWLPNIEIINNQYLNFFN